MFRSAREYMLTCAFFKILHIYIIINNFKFEHLSAIFFFTSYIDWRRKLHSIKSERFEGVLGSIDEKSPFVNS